MVPDSDCAFVSSRENASGMTGVDEWSRYQVFIASDRSISARYAGSDEPRPYFSFSATERCSSALNACGEYELDTGVATWLRSLSIRACATGVTTAATAIARIKPFIVFLL